MLKPSPSRNQRSKGFKIKHVLQIFLLLAIGIWLLNRLKHSPHYRINNAHDQETIGKKSENPLSEHEVIKFGRKDLHPRVEESGTEVESRDRPESEEEIEDVKGEDIEDDGRGGGDDEIDGHDQERAEEEESEEVEDLIDVEDREKEEGSEEQEQENEEKGSTQLEDEDGRSVNKQSQQEGRRSVQEAREEHYKGDDASSSVMQELEI